MGNFKSLHDVEEGLDTSRYARNTPMKRLAITSLIAISVSVVFALYVGRSRATPIQAAVELAPGITAVTSGPVPDEFESDSQFTDGVKAEVMTQACCYAGSRMRDHAAPGGYGPSDNFPVGIAKAEAKSTGRVYLLALPKVGVDFGDRKGLKLLLVNSTDEAFWFDACDSCVDIVQEAKDEKGIWKPVQMLPNSGCGNSYHRVGLSANQYWSFAQPRFEGVFKTSLRFVLFADGRELIVSNEFAGSIHPGQFRSPQPEQR